MGDGDGHRQLDVVVAFAGEQGARFLFEQPARLRDLFAVDRKIEGPRPGVTADHQGRGKRPGLGCVIENIADRQMHFFAQFASHRFFDGLARLDETGEG